MVRPSVNDTEVVFPPPMSQKSAGVLRPRQMPPQKRSKWRGSAWGLQLRYVDRTAESASGDSRRAERTGLERATPAHPRCCEQPIRVQGTFAPLSQHVAWEEARKPSAPPADGTSWAEIRHRGVGPSLQGIDWRSGKIFDSRRGRHDQRIAQTWRLRSWPRGPEPPGSGLQGSWAPYALLDSIGLRFHGPVECSVGFEKVQNTVDVGFLQSTSVTIR